MSVFTLLTAGLALMLPLTSAYTTPVGDEPKGNAISQPGLNTIVPAGEDFTITWDPTTSGPVTLILLKGPATNLKLSTVIVQGTENDGSFVWNPSTDLEPTADATGYGIQLIVDSGDAKGQYQYTTQFGISNPSYGKEKKDVSPASSSSSSSSSSSTPAVSPPLYGKTTTEPLHTATASPSSVMHSSSSSSMIMMPTASANTSSTATSTMIMSSVQPTAYAKPTAWTTMLNGTAGVGPTGSGSSSNSSSPTSSMSVSMGGAAGLQAGVFASVVVAAGVVAVFA